MLNLRGGAKCQSKYQSEFFLHCVLNNLRSDNKKILASDQQLESVFISARGLKDGFREFEYAGYPKAKFLLNIHFEFLVRMGETKDFEEIVGVCNDHEDYKYLSYLNFRPEERGRGRTKEQAIKKLWFTVVGEAMRLLIENKIIKNINQIADFFQRYLPYPTSSHRILSFLGTINENFDLLLTSGVKLEYSEIKKAIENEEQDWSKHGGRFEQLYWNSSDGYNNELLASIEQKCVKMQPENSFNTELSSEELESKGNEEMELFKDQSTIDNPKEKFGGDKITGESFTCFGLFQGQI